jgi:tripartite-type tricarboxylate transporter receptor subunit TctC
MNRRFHSVAAALAALSVATAASAQTQAYPSKSVRVVVPFPAGSGVDIIARAVASRLGDDFGQQFVADNRPGASGNLGSAIVAHAAPDGHTLLFFPSSVVSSYALLPKQEYSLEKDLEPLSLSASAPNLLVVHPSLPARNVRELIALARARPGQLNYASFGIGGIPHLAGEMFKLRAKVNIVHVPYKGMAGAVTDLIAGQISIIFANTLSVAAYLGAGRLRAIAISSAQRSPAAPSLPTIAESGLPGFEAVTWFGMAAPAGTPREIAERLSASLRRIVQTRAMNDLLLAQGADAIASTAPEFREKIRADLVMWSSIIKAAGVRPE